MMTAEIQTLCQGLFRDLEQGEARLQGLKDLRPHVKDTGQFLIDIRLQELEQSLHTAKGIALLASALIAGRDGKKTRKEEAKSRWDSKGN